MQTGLNLLAEAKKRKQKEIVVILMTRHRLDQLGKPSVLVRADRVIE
jgi:hypothetical protein